MVDGGISSLIPLDVLQQAGMDISIGINMRGTKHIFASRYLTLRSVLNKFKKLIFLDELEAVVDNLWKEEEIDLEKTPDIFTVLGKSLDWALKASKRDGEALKPCDLLITPNIPLHDRKEMMAFHPYYEYGKQTAQEYVPKIKQLIEEKTKTPSIVKSE